MTDRELEKVITGLEDSLANNGCGFMDGIGELFAVSGEDLQNAIALLRAQEPMEPKWKKGYAYCGKCGYKLHWIVDQNNFCPNCGQEVKWNG